MTDLTRLTIADARKGLDARDFTALELTDAYLAAIDAANATFNAYVAVTPDKARDMAKVSDSRIAYGEAGALEGIPLGIKDLFATEGVHTQAASHILDGFQPRYESTVTANLWADGAVMLGKLNMDEFAMGSSNETSYYGPVVNPWRARGDNKQLVPGGSSGGSAAAVSAWLCAGATATDTGGSIRQPAAFTGTAAARAGAPSPSPPRWTRPARSRAMFATRRSCSGRWPRSTRRTRPPSTARCPTTRRRSASPSGA
jgi:aspartyl-tRNA(Asn)/glutamyl-tRNA(Gln) amidotransferase subunit A